MAALPFGGYPALGCFGVGGTCRKFWDQRMNRLDDYLSKLQTKEQKKAMAFRAKQFKET
jgi:hypothetical protein